MQYRRDRGDMIEVYKFTHEMYNVRSPFTTVGDTKTRSHSHKLKKTRVKTGLRQHFFSVRVTDTWNNLPDEIVNAPFLNCFTSRLTPFGVAVSTSTDLALGDRQHKV